MQSHNYKETGIASGRQSKQRRVSSITPFSAAFGNNNSMIRPVSSVPKTPNTSPQRPAHFALRPTLKAPVSSYRAPASQNQARLPRSLTYSNLPRPITDSRKPSGPRPNRLQSSQSSTALLAHRAPSPLPSPEKRPLATHPVSPLPGDQRRELSIRNQNIHAESVQKQSRFYSLNEDVTISKEASTDACTGIGFSDLSRSGLSRSMHNLRLSVPRRSTTIKDQVSERPQLSGLSKAMDVPPRTPPHRDIDEDAQPSQSKIERLESTPNHHNEGSSRVQQVHHVRHYQLLKAINSAETQSAPRLSLDGLDHEFGPELQQMIADTASPGGPPTILKDRILKPVPPAATYQGESTAYWTGRFISLNDRLLNERCDIPPPGEDNATGKMVTREMIRVQHVLRLLEECCKTPAARESFMRFRRQCVVQKGMPQMLSPSPRKVPLERSAGNARRVEELSLGSPAISEAMAAGESHIFKWSDAMSRLKNKKEEKACGSLVSLQSSITSEGESSQASTRVNQAGRRSSFMDMLTRKRDSKRQSIYLE